MRTFAKVSPQFWIETSRTLRHKGPDALLVALYLLTNPHANMLGLYYLPTAYIAHETGLGADQALKALKAVCNSGFCAYDFDKEIVFVSEMAAFQIGEQLAASDKRCSGVRREYDALPLNRFLGAFFDRYANAFHITNRRGESSYQDPTECLPSKEKEKEKEKEKQKETETETETESKKEPEKKKEPEEKEDHDSATNLFESLRNEIKSTYRNTNGRECSWNQATDVELRAVLKSRSWPLAAWRESIENRFHSEVERGEVPRYWLRKLPTYRNSPLDKRDKPIARSVASRG